MNNITNLKVGKLYKTLCPISVDVGIVGIDWFDISEDTIIMHISTIKLDIERYKHTILLVQNGRLYSRALPQGHFEDWVKELK